MPEKLFRRGDRVRFQMGTQFVEGEIKEDRGPIGVGGRRLYRIEFQFGEDSPEPSQIELPAVEFEPIRGTASAK